LKRPHSVGLHIRPTACGAHGLVAHLAHWAEMAEASCCPRRWAQASGIPAGSPRTARRSGAVPTDSPVAEVESVGWGKHRRRAVDMPGKETRAGAHRGGGTMVGWQREFGATAVDGGECPDCGRCCPKELPWLCKSEGEVRAKPKLERGRRWCRGRISSEGQRSDGGDGQKSNREGGFTHGGASEVGQRRRKEPRHGGVRRRPFEADAGEVGEGGVSGSAHVKEGEGWGGGVGSGSVAPREGRRGRAWRGQAPAGARDRQGRVAVIPA
jgi:hypothetical protein